MEHWLEILPAGFTMHLEGISMVSTWPIGTNSLLLAVTSMLNLGLWSKNYENGEC